MECYVKCLQILMSWKIKLFDQGSSCLTDLDQVSTVFCRSPLHMAVMRGDIKVVEKILGSRCDLALKRDSQGFTPLHLASTRTSLRMVKVLLRADSDACMCQDKCGRTPLHLAVLNDRTMIMEVLIEARPEAIHLRHNRNENLLHFCVKHNSNKLKALRLLVEYLVGAQPANENDISVNSTDNDGNTILHLAAKMKKFKILDYLLNKDLRIDLDVENNKHNTVLNMLSHTERNNLEFGFYDHPERAKKQKKKTSGRNDEGDWLKERVNALMLVATLIAGIACQAATNPPGGVWQEDSKVDSGTEPVTFSYYMYHMFDSSYLTISGYWDSYINYYWQPSGLISKHTLVAPNGTEIYEFIDSLLLVSSNYSMNVLGGIIMEDVNFKSIVSNYNTSGGISFPYLIRYAGFPILAYTYPVHYTVYMVTNTVAFLMSVTIILLVICGFMDVTSTNQVRLLVVLMCISIGCITFGYLAIFLAMTPDFYICDPILYSVAVYVLLWCICGIIWKLMIPNIVKLQRRHLVGLHEYLEMHFHGGSKNTTKSILFICGIVVFFIILASTIYPWFYTPLRY